MIGEDDLTATERRIIDAARNGEWVRLGTRGNDDPARGATWSRPRTIRAEFLAELVTGGLQPTAGTLRSVRVSGARVVGSLDLAYASISCPLLLQSCYLDDPVTLMRAHAPLISLVDCRVPRIDASGLDTLGDVDFVGVHCSQVLLMSARIGGDVNLDRATLTGNDGVAFLADQLHVERSLLCRFGFSATGLVQMHGARIGGQLALDGATLVNPEGHALACDHLVVGRDLSGRRLSAQGEVWLHGAHIGGDLDLSGATLANPGGNALVATHLKVAHTMSCGYGFNASGQLYLPGVEIGGQLDLCEATLRNAQGIALDAGGLRVEQGMLGRNGFCAEGEVVINGAQIGIQLDLDGARLTNKGGTALRAERLTVKGSMLCANGFTATGEVRLPHAHITGSLQLDGAALINPEGSAVTADSLTVDGDLVCTEGFRAEGEIRIFSARIGGWLRLRGARLTNPQGWTLAADQITVGQSMDCSEGFRSEGGVRLSGSHIGSQLNFAGAHLNNPDGEALQAQGINVEMDVLCRDGFSAAGQVALRGGSIGGHLDFDGAKITGFDGSTINLMYAKASILILRPDECHNGVVDLRLARVGLLVDDEATWPAAVALDDFVYERLGGKSTRVSGRLRWLKRNRGGYVPQIYDQLATVYRQAGDESAARRVAIAKQWNRRHQLNPLGRAWNWLLYLTVGYGYRTWLAALWLAALVVVGSLVFGHAHMEATTGTPPAFHPTAYTVDVLLPIVDIGQQKAWLPQGAALYWTWTLTAAGWVLTTAVVAGLTSVLRRE